MRAFSNVNDCFQKEPCLCELDGLRKEWTVHMQDNRQKTITFSVKDTRREEIREIVKGVYNSLIESGYNPTNQIVGYIISEDPTYITNYKNARTIISKLDRDELLRALVEDFIRLEQK